MRGRHLRAHRFSARNTRNEETFVPFILLANVIYASDNTTVSILDARFFPRFISMHNEEKGTSEHAGIPFIQNFRSSRRGKLYLDDFLTIGRQMHRTVLFRGY